MSRNGEHSGDERNDSDDFAWTPNGSRSDDDSLAKIGELLDHVLATGSTRSLEVTANAPVAMEAPTQVGRFEIREEMGRGGFGVVYRAFDTVLERDVALKVIARRKSEAMDEVSRLSEARATANMNHPHLVPLYEVMEDEHCIYLVSELCPGQTLTDFLREHPDGIPPKWAAEIASKLAAAVAHAHRRGFVHRDIKPSNVLLVPDREQDDEIASAGVTRRDSVARTQRLPFTPRLTDFGLVRDIMDSIQSRERGQIVGTLSYIAPEQLAAERVADGPSMELRLGDVYSLGVVIYQMLIGSVPFRSKSPIQLIELMTSSDPPPLRATKPVIDRDLEAICLRCLQRSPDERYESVQALSDDLERYREGYPVRARPQSRRERVGTVIRRSPVESSLIAGLIAMSILAAVTFAWSNRSLRRQSASLAIAVEVASKNELLAKQAEELAEEALLEAEDERRKSEASKLAALEIAYQSDMRQAFDAIAMNDTANSLSIAEDILGYSNADRVKSRLDWRLLQTFASRGWQALPNGSAGEPSPITEIRIIPGRNWVASTSQDGWVRVHDHDCRLVAETRLEHQGLLGTPERVEVRALAASADGRWLAVGKSVAASWSSWSNRTSVEVIDLNELEKPVGDTSRLPVTQSITGFDATVESLAFSNDSKKIVVGPRYEPIQVIDLHAPEQRFDSPSMRRNENIFVTEKGDLVWVASPYHVEILDLKTREARHLVSGIDGHSLAVSAATSDASRIFCTLPSSHQIYVVKTDDETPSWYRIECPYGMISAVALSPDEQHLVFGTAGGGVGVWRMSDFREDSVPTEQPDSTEPDVQVVTPIQYHVRHRGPVLSLSVGTTGRVHSGGKDGMLAVSSIGTTEVTKSPDSSANANANATSPVTGGAVLQSLQGLDSTHACMSEDGRFLFQMTSDGDVFRHEMETGQVRLEIPGNGEYGSWLSISEDREWLMAGDYSGQLMIKQISGDEKTFDCSVSKFAQEDKTGVRQVQFNPSGDHLVVSQDGNLIHWFSLNRSLNQGGSDIVSEIDHEGTVHLRRSAKAVFFTSEDELLIVSDYFSRLRLGDIAETEVGPGIDFIQSVCQDPTRERFLIGTTDGRIHAINQDGESVTTSRQWPSTDGAVDQHHDISTLTISSDGQIVLSGSMRGVIGIWNAENLRYLGSVAPSSDLRQIAGLSVSADGRWMLFHCRNQSFNFDEIKSKLYVVRLQGD